MFTCTVVALLAASGGPDAGAPPAEGEALVWAAAGSLPDSVRQLQDAQSGLRLFEDLKVFSFAPGFPRTVESGSFPGMKAGVQLTLLGVCPAAATAPLLALFRSVNPEAALLHVKAPPDACPAIEPSARVTHTEQLAAGRGKLVMSRITWRKSAILRATLWNDAWQLSQAEYWGEGAALQTRGDAQACPGDFRMDAGAFRFASCGECLNETCCTQGRFQMAVRPGKAGALSIDRALASSRRVCDGG